MPLALAILVLLGLGYLIVHPLRSIGLILRFLLGLVVLVLVLALIGSALNGPHH